MNSECLSIQYLQSLLYNIIVLRVKLKMYFIIINKRSSLFILFFYRSIIILNPSFLSSF